jgi:hypothetical protein
VQANETHLPLVQVLLIGQSVAEAHCLQVPFKHCIVHDGCALSVVTALLKHAMGLLESAQVVGIYDESNVAHPVVHDDGHVLIFKLC